MASKTITPRAYTIAEAAQILKVCEVTVRRKCADGTIPYFRLGRSIRIKASALDKLLAA